MLILGYGSSGGGISSACTLQSGCRNSLAFPRVNTTWRPVAAANSSDARAAVRKAKTGNGRKRALRRSEEHTSELQSLMRISYAVFCLKKKKDNRRARTDNIGDADCLSRVRRTLDNKSDHTGK